MGSSRARLVVNLLLAVLVFVGVSASVSDWFDAFYSEIAVWALIIGIPLGALIYWIKGLDPGLETEVRISWRKERHGGNAEAVARLNALHAEHPEVAEKLSARMAEEKHRREMGTVPPPTGA